MYIIIYCVSKYELPPRYIIYIISSVIKNENYLFVVSRKSSRILHLY